jgi:hypothetical protein
MRLLLSSALLLIVASEAFAQGRLVSLEADQKNTEGTTVTTVLTFDKGASLVYHGNVDQFGKSSTKMGEYRYENERLKVQWFNDGSIEEVALTDIDEDRVEYRVLKDSRDARRVGTVIRMRRGVIPESTAMSALRFGDLYLEVKRRQVANASNSGNAFMQMQHELNMKLLESSKEFGRSLGFPTID